MKRKRFTEEQIIGILKEAEQAGNIREVCRLHNLTEQTFYRWRNKFGGMDVSEAKKLRELERENTELKKMVAELSLDVRMLKDLNSHDVVRVLNQLVESRGHPAIIKSDNGSEFVATRIQEWIEEPPHGALNQITPAAYAARLALNHGKAA
jgi:putative transposase